jgi:2-methylisocitrate lyase-like PEP mutase family enzyme
VNVLIIPGIPELNILNELGVARVSLGPSLLKIAIRSMKNLAMKLQSYNGLSDITENEITSDYLKGLVNKATQ